MKTVCIFHSVDLDEQSQMECFHYSNLQPLEAGENLKKYNKFNIEENKNE